MKRNRRNFISTAAVGFAAGTSALSAMFNRRKLRLGGPAFIDSKDPAEVAEAHSKLGYRAAYCPNIQIHEKDLISAYRSEFSKRDIVIAEAGAWVNLLDADPVKRKKNFDFVAEKLALADEIGALCCVDIAGSYNPTNWAGPHPDNLSQRFFDETVENVRGLLKEVKPRRAKFTIEMMGWAIPTTSQEYLRLIKAVDHKMFGVHVDVCNMINSPEKIYANTGLIQECFSKLGPWIVSCHAKDVAWVEELQVRFREVIPGTGHLDYRTYISEISKLDQDVPLMMEHLQKPEEYAQGADFIRKTAAEIGLSFE